MPGFRVPPGPTGTLLPGSGLLADLPSTLCLWLINTPSISHQVWEGRYKTRFQFTAFQPKHGARTAGAGRGLGCLSRRAALVTRVLRGSAGVPVTFVTLAVLSIWQGLAVALESCRESLLSI